MTADPTYRPAVYAPVASSGQVREEKLNVKQAARFFGVSPMTVYRVIRSGELRAYQIGRQYLIPISAAREFLGTCEVVIEADE